MRYVLVFVVLLNLVLVSCTTQQHQPTLPILSPSSVPEPQQDKSLTKTSEGEVSVELTPGKYSNGVFNVHYALNTHSVDMSTIDLQQQVTLVVDGKSYSPQNKPVLSGHHTSGELEFQVALKPDTFEIVVVNVSDVSERRFVWP